MHLNPHLVFMKSWTMGFNLSFKVTVHINTSPWLWLLHGFRFLSTRHKRHGTDGDIGALCRLPTLQIHPLPIHTQTLVFFGSGDPFFKDLTLSLSHTHIHPVTNELEKAYRQQI